MLISPHKEGSEIAPSPGAILYTYRTSRGSGTGNVPGLPGKNPSRIPAYLVVKRNPKYRPKTEGNNDAELE